MTEIEPDGTLAGAVYTPVPVIQPTVEFPPRVPLTIQCTAVLLVPDTKAPNCWVRLTCILVLVGEIETAMEEVPVIEILALAYALGSAVLRAVMVTGPEGALDGAVYNPELVIVPTVALPPALPLTSQIRPRWSVPDTDALNCCV